MFPLFQTLFKMTESLSHKNMEYKDRIELGEEIKQLDKTAHEYLYAIIRTYQLEMEKDQFQNLPYSMKVNKNSVKFEMSKMPNRLILIIKQFVELHVKSLEESSSRSNFFEKKPISTTEMED